MQDGEQFNPVSFQYTKFTIFTFVVNDNVGYKYMLIIHLISRV